MESFKFALAKVLNVDETIAGAFERGDYFIELELNGERVLVLGALNEKDHQERNDGSAGVDDKLPRIGKIKERTRDQPYDNQESCEGEGP